MAILAGFLAGLLVLVGGAVVLVRGSSRLALSLGITPLVVGLTVVAFGTSSPELAVTVLSSVRGETELALGNVVGSNITNILLILGLAAVVRPVEVTPKVIRFDVPLMTALSALLLLMGADGRIGPADGLLLLAGLVVYTALAVVSGRRDAAAVRDQYEKALGSAPSRGLWASCRNLSLAAGGLLLLLLGSKLLVDSAVAFAQKRGVSPLVIGLTVVAVGTSLPEAATTLVASLRGERDIAVGNAIGSCVLNVLAILGLAAVVAPGGIPVPSSLMHFDLPFLVVVSAACLPVFLHGFRLYRWEGAVFLLYFAAYMGFQVASAMGRATLFRYELLSAAFLVPITLVTLAVLSIGLWRQHRHKRR